MANTKISALTALAGADVDTAADVLAIVDTGVTTTKKILVDELAIAMRATQAEMEAATSASTTVAPSVMHFHPGVAKAFVQFTLSGTTVTVNRSYNVTSVVRDSIGVYTITFTTAFSDAFYSFSVSGNPVSNGSNVCYPFKKAGGTYSTTAFQVEMSVSGNAGGGTPEATTISAAFFGDI